VLFVYVSCLGYFVCLECVFSVCACDGILLVFFVCSLWASVLCVYILWERFVCTISVCASRVCLACSERVLSVPCVCILRVCFVFVFRVVGFLLCVLCASYVCL